MSLEFKPEMVELTDEELWLEIRAYECKYGMRSDQFLERFNRGEMMKPSKWRICRAWMDWYWSQLFHPCRPAFIHE